MQNIVIFALIGAVCMFIVTGGALSMTSDADPEPASLFSGAALGGALGAATSYLMTADVPSMIGGGLDSIGSFGSLSSFGSSDGPDMKVGLPSF